MRLIGDLITVVLMYGVVVMFIASPIKVIGWCLGYGREIFADPSEDAKLCITVYTVTTAIVVGLGILWIVQCNIK